MRNVLGLLIVAALISLGASSALAQSVEQFYKGRTLTMIISVGPGDGFDVNGRLVARYLARHIPGNPTIVAKNVSGAGHMLAANYMFNEATRDGTTIATTLPAIITHQLLEGRGVRYDVGKFQWLGANDVNNQNVYVWAQSGLKTLQDVRSREVTIGATGAGSYTLLYPRLMNRLVGTRFKIVSGYPAAAQIDLAMQRGEVEARAGSYFSTLEVTNPDWLRDKKINFIVQIGIEPDRNYAEVPMLTDFATSQEDRAVISLFATEAAAGHPYYAAPDVPPERLAILRRAFDETMADEAYRTDARKMGLTTTSLPTARLKQMIGNVTKVPARVIEIARAIKDAADIPAAGKP